MAILRIRYSQRLSAPTLALKTQTDIRPQELTIADETLCCTPLIHYQPTKPSALNTVQPSTTTFPKHCPRRAESSSLPLFRQIPSRPHQMEFTISAFLGIPDPNHHHSAPTRITNLISFYQHILTHQRMSFHAGEFWKITPATIHSYTLSGSPSPDEENDAPLPFFPGFQIPGTFMYP